MTWPMKICLKKTWSPQEIDEASKKLSEDDDSVDIHENPRQNNANYLNMSLSQEMDYLDYDLTSK